MEGDEIVCCFTTIDMVGVIQQRFVKTEVSAIVDDHPSKTQVMVYTLHIFEPRNNAHFSIHISSVLSYTMQFITKLAFMSCNNAIS